MLNRYSSFRFPQYPERLLLNIDEISSIIHVICRQHVFTTWYVVSTCLPRDMPSARVYHVICRQHVFTLLKHHSKRIPPSIESGSEAFVVFHLFHCAWLGVVGRVIDRDPYQHRTTDCRSYDAQPNIHTENTQTSSVNQKQIWKRHVYLPQGHHIRKSVFQISPSLDNGYLRG